MVGLLETVFDHQVQVVALIEDLAVDVGVESLETTDLAILLGHQLLIHRCDLDEHLIVGQVEVRREPLGRLAVLIEIDREAPRLVVPGNSVEVEKEGELPLTVVSEIDVVCRRALCAQGAPASITPANSTSPGNN